MLAAVADTGKFEFKEGVATTATGVAKEGVGMIPVVGSIASFVGHLAALGVRKIESHLIERDVKRISAMNPSQDMEDWYSFTKDLSASVIASKAKQIATMDEKQIAELAKKDAGRIAEEIMDGKAKTIDDEEAISGLTKVVTGVEKSTSEKPAATFRPVEVLQPFPHLVGAARAA